MIAERVPLAELRWLQAMRYEQERRLYQAVREARLAGATWDQIAAALGISRQGAHKRFRRACQPVAR